MACILALYSSNFQLLITLASDIEIFKIIVKYEIEFLIADMYISRPRNQTLFSSIKMSSVSPVSYMQVSYGLSTQGYKRRLATRLFISQFQGKCTCKPERCTDDGLYALKQFSTALDERSSFESTTICRV